MNCTPFTQATDSNTKNTSPALTNAISDADARRQALHAHQSFLVQAPAGSGKTTLLVQRIIALLARVQHPEQILALTHTKKATAEIKHRLAAFVHVAAQPAASDGCNDYDSELTENFKQHCTAQGWDLSQLASRLGIFTFDSFANQLVRTAPLQAGNTALYSVLEYHTFYQSAARQLLQQLDDANEVAESLRAVLQHIGCDAQHLEQLLVEMLARRDQWSNLLPSTPSTTPLADTQAHNDNAQGAIGQAQGAEDSTSQWQQQLQTNLITLVTAELQQVSTIFQHWGSLPNVMSLGGMDAVFETLRYAAGNAEDLLNVETSPKKTKKKLSSIASLNTIEQWPSALPQHLSAWKAFAGIFLIDGKKLRKSFTKDVGFPAKTSTKNKDEAAIYEQMKQQVGDIQQALADQSCNSTPSCFNCPLCMFRQIDILFEPAYNPTEKAILHHLSVVMQAATKQLDQIFQFSSSTDFIEKSHSALRLLTTAQQPSTQPSNTNRHNAHHLPMLNRPQHILVDEFQDTSHLQLQLLCALVKGWQDNDGHSIFLVGDPMQSIYRFRKAEVGIFLQVKNCGLMQLKLYFLSLHTSFRATTPLINWFNQTFASLFAQQDQVSIGAVRYTALTPRPEERNKEHSREYNDVYSKEHADKSNGKHNDEYSGEYSDKEAANQSAFAEDIPVEWIAATDSKTEAKEIAERIQTFTQKHPDDSIAILVRTRSHSLLIQQALQQVSVPFVGTNIVKLEDDLAVQDLITLMKTLANPHDRLAWLAFLRTPWCGLSLPDLLLIAEDKQAVIWDQLHDPTLLRNLSAESQYAVKSVCNTLQQAFDLQECLPVKDWVEHTWHNLYAFADLDAGQQQNVEMVLQMTNDISAPLTTLAVLELQNRVSQSHGDRAYAHSQTNSTGTAAANPLQLMTIHQAKGLEFDRVFLPTLEKTTRPNTSPLLRWEQLLPTDGFSEQPNLILAPIPPDRQVNKTDSLWQYLKEMNERKAHYESDRLLYVACTRAKKKLVLSTGDALLTRRQSKSFLTKLIHTFEAQLENLPSLHEKQADESVPMPRLRMQRLVRKMEKKIQHPSANPTQIDTLSTLEQNLPLNTHLKPDTSSPPFDWASYTARHVGIIAHLLLEHIAQTGLMHWNENTLNNARPWIKKKLAQVGIFNNELLKATNTVFDAIWNTLHDETKGRWILSQQNQAMHEYRLTAMDSGHPRRFRIDSTFVDNGYRWIVDYKISPHQSTNQTVFLDLQQQRYTPQMEQYAKGLQSIYPDLSFQLVLYFPLQTDWRSWIYPAKES